MTSEATFEVRFELSGLNYLSSYDCLASKCHCSQKFPAPIPPTPPLTVPIRAIDQREREALPADKNKGQIRDIPRQNFEKNKGQCLGKKITMSHI